MPAGAPAGWFIVAAGVAGAVAAGTYVLAFLGGNTDRGAVPYFYIPAQSIGYNNGNTDAGGVTFVPSDPFGTITHFAGEIPKAYITYTQTSAGAALSANTALPGLAAPPSKGRC